MLQANQQFSLAAARKIVADLFDRRPLIYWTDFLVSLGIGYAAAAVYLPAQPFSAVKWIAFLVAGFALFRVGSFIHEIVHFRQGEMTAFAAAWNVLAGVPMLMPSWFYGNHIDHHNNHHYGTGQDGEYLPLGAGPLRQIALFFSQLFVLPIFVAVRFVILTPLSFLHPRLRRWTLERCSSYVINFGYRRPALVDSPLPRWWTLLEIACFVRAAGFIVFCMVGIQDWTRIFSLYLIAVFVLGLNYVRNLVAHRYVNAGEPMSHQEQLLDSINITGGALTSLFFPLGLRYHALHHLFPGLPFHNLAAAHRRLMAQLPADSAYRDTVFPSYWSAVQSLVQSAKAASAQRPSGAQVWYADRKRWWRRRASAT